MIQITYSIPFTGGSNLATQVAEAQAAPLNQGELDLLGLTIASDNTSFNSTTQNIERVVQFNETPRFVEAIGLPFSTAKRKAAVKGLFNYKLTLETKKHVGETIALR